MLRREKVKDDESERHLCPEWEHSAEAELSLGETGAVSWSEDSRLFGTGQEPSSCCVLGRDVIVKYPTVSNLEISHYQFRKTQKRSNTSEIVTAYVYVYTRLVKMTELWILSLIV